MPRVSKEKKIAVENAVKALPADTLKTCGSCNITMYNEIARIQAETKTQMTTVAKAVANRINELKVTDPVTEEQIVNRAKRQKQKENDDIGSKRPHNDEAPESGLNEPEKDDKPKTTPKPKKKKTAKTGLNDRYEAAVNELLRVVDELSKEKFKSVKKAQVIDDLAIITLKLEHK